MKHLAAILILPLLLGGCLGLFEDPNPPVDTTRKYATEVCGTAGRQSLACADARRQVELRCFRTLGRVNCYTSEDPFQAFGTARSIALPVDKRPSSASPG